MMGTAGRRAGRSRGPSRRHRTPGGILNLLLHALAAVALLLPLTALGVTRFRVPILVALAVLWGVSLLVGQRLPAVASVLRYGYYGVCVLAVAASRNVLLSVDPSALWRSLATSAALVGLLLTVRGMLLSRRPPTGASTGAHRFCLAGLLPLVGAMLLFRLGWWGLFANWGIVPALLVVIPMVVLKPRPILLAAWTACAVIVVYEWLGFMNLARYTEALDTDPPWGITVEVIDHGDPVRIPGARYFQPGTCPETEDAYYMGEGRRTYRLNPDGTETVFFTGAESSQNLIELCEEGIVVTGSFEQKFVLFADLKTGRTLKRIPMESHPTSMILAPDRRRLYTGASMPGMLFAIDMESREVVGRFDRYADIDPAFSGICNILFQGDRTSGDRILGVYSSWFMADHRPGEVFTVDGALGDWKPHGNYLGAWGFTAPGINGWHGAYLRSYDYPPIFKVAPDSDLEEIFSVPRGYYYITTLEAVGLVVTNHWTTGDIIAFCEDDPARSVRIAVGGMGRMLHGRGRQIFTPAAAGYLILTFPEDVCS